MRENKYNKVKYEIYYYIVKIVHYKIHEVANLMVLTQKKLIGPR
jgi:hypothetical protein